MIGDLILWIKEHLRQMFCNHEYRERDLPANMSFRYCTKCGKIKKP